MFVATLEDYETFIGIIEAGSLTKAELRGADHSGPSAVH